ncbi:hypothetical protein NMY22_g6608 [Coprinellus aureogranulatus]|nr:hypothetical protein NMY22_g6608 [Coprinellus aureogranulatus]
MTGRYTALLSPPLYPSGRFSDCGVCARFKLRLARDGCVLAACIVVQFHHHRCARGRACGGVKVEAWIPGLACSTFVPPEGLFNSSRASTATGMSQWSGISAASLDGIVPISRTFSSSSLGSSPYHPSPSHLASKLTLPTPPRSHPLPIAPQTPKYDYNSSSTPAPPPIGLNRRYLLRQYTQKARPPALKVLPSPFSTRTHDVVLHLITPLADTTLDIHEWGAARPSSLSVYAQGPKSPFRTQKPRLTPWPSMETRLDDRKQDVSARSPKVNAAAPPSSPIPIVSRSDSRLEVYVLHSPIQTRHTRTTHHLS